MTELIAAIHLHTLYSGGNHTHAELHRLALAAGFDVCLVTDKNVLVQDIEGYAQENNHTCLMLTGEVLFDRSKRPERGRLLVLNAAQELAPFAAEPQQVCALAAEKGSPVFAAHPAVPAQTRLGSLLPGWLPADLPEGITGLELWNSLSELQGRASNRCLAVLYSWLPRLGRRGPAPAARAMWHEMLATGHKVSAIAGSSLGHLENAPAPLQEYLLKNLTTHLLVPGPLTGTLAQDRPMIFHALAEGHAFIGCDDLAPTRGFQFRAHGRDHTAGLGETLFMKDSVTMQIRLPQAAQCFLFKDGDVVRTWHNKETCIHSTNQPGVYYVEARLPWLGQECTWILSNPIYVRQYVPPPLDDQIYEF